MSCDACTELAVVFLPGCATAGAPLRAWCLCHAGTAGWPWLISEEQRRISKKQGAA